MARIDTLGNFLTDVAEAIKNKTGKTDAITPANFDTEIASIEGGGNSKYTPKYISFANYTGTDLTEEVKNLDVVNMTSFNTSYGLFQYCRGITSLDLSHWDTSNITNMGSTFSGCERLTSLDVSGWDTSKVTNMAYMFSGCQKLARLDLSSWYTPNLTSTNNMFYNGSVNAWEHLDIRNFDFSKVTSYDNMFGSKSYNFKANCEIIVKDDAAKQWILGVRSDFTNVKTVAEYEAEQQSL